LIHVSELGAGKVSDIEEIVRVGDRVLTQVLPASNAKKLSLRLIKIFQADGTEVTPQQLAMLRRGEYLEPKFKRFEDAVVDASIGRYSTVEAIDSAEEDPFAWAAAGATGYNDESEEDDDPWAWAAASSTDSEVDDGRASDTADEEEDPFAWAAAAASDGSSAEEETEEEEEDPFAWAAASTETESEEEDEDEPDFGEEYFEDKYELDTW